MKTLSLSDFKTPLNGGKTRLRAKTTADAERDYRWQSDAEMALLDATPPLRMTFSRYLAAYRQALGAPSPTRQIFAVETLSGEHIGNLSYYGINEEKGEAELGVMIGQRGYLGKGYGRDAISTILRHIFSQTNLRRITLKTLKGNIRAQKCFIKCGFVPSGEKTIEGRHFLLMAIERTRWLELSGKNQTTTRSNGETTGAEIEEF